MDWGKEKNFYKDYPALKYKAYKDIGTYINEKKIKKILDFGCGDGKQLEFIDKKIVTDLYDINEEALKKASKKLKNSKSSVFNITNDIKKNTYELVVFSLVLMCLSNEKELNEIVKSFKGFLKKNGEVIVLITHPAFRDKEFSYYETNVTSNFNYFNEGFPFKVSLKNVKHEIFFTDYHWTISKTINLFISKGFELLKMVELQDTNTENDFYNKSFSPYMKLIFKKK